MNKEPSLYDNSLLIESGRFGKVLSSNFWKYTKNTVVEELNSDENVANFSIRLEEFYGEELELKEVFDHINLVGTMNPVDRMKQMVNIYGQPRIFDKTKGGLVLWNRKNLMEKDPDHPIQELRLVDPPNFMPTHMIPIPHIVYLTSTMYVGSKWVSNLSMSRCNVEKLSDSVSIDPIAGTISARSHFEHANNVAIYLALMMIFNDLPLEEAKMYYTPLILGGCPAMKEKIDYYDDGFQKRIYKQLKVLKEHINDFAETGRMTLSRVIVPESEKYKAVKENLVPFIFKLIKEEEIAIVMYKEGIRKAKTKNGFENKALALKEFEEHIHDEEKHKMWLVELVKRMYPDLLKEPILGFDGNVKETFLTNVSVSCEYERPRTTVRGIVQQSVYAEKCAIESTKGVLSVVDNISKREDMKFYSNHILAKMKYYLESIIKDEVEHRDDLNNLLIINIE